MNYTIKSLKNKLKSYDGYSPQPNSLLNKATGVHIKQNVDAIRDNVLYESVDCSIEGLVTSPAAVLHKSKNSHIKGKVKCEDDVLYGAKNSFVEGDVISKDSVLSSAEKSYIQGNVEGSTILQKAVDSFVKGNAKTTHGIYGYVLFGAKDSYIEGDVDSTGEVLWDAIDSHIKGNVKSRKRVLYEANKSYIEGDLESKMNVLEQAKDSYIIGDVIGNEVLIMAKNCYIVGEEIFTKGLGWSSKGGLVASKDIICSGDVGDAVTILTQNRPVKGAVRFKGDWKALSDYLSGELKKDNFGELEALKLFKIEKKETDIKGFKKELSKLNKDYAEVKSAFDDYEELGKILELKNISHDNNESKKNYFAYMGTEIKRKLMAKFELKEKTAELLKNTPQRKDIITELEKAGDDHHFEGRLGNVNTFYQITGKSIDDFIQRYSNHKASDFKRTYTLKLKTAASDQSIGRTNEILYKQGLDLIEQIRVDGVGLDMSWNIDVKDLIDEKRFIATQIGELMRNGKDATRLLDKKEAIERALKTTKMNKVEDIIEDIIDSNNDAGTDSEISISGVKEILSQLSQHYLGGKHKQIAEHISSQLVVKENDLSSNVLHAELWNKDISNIPTYEEFRCCGFLGRGDGSIFGYMASNAVELMRFDVGDKSAMAIMAETVDSKGKKVLVVDSVESSSHMLGREEVANAIAKAIESYARKEGFSEVIYSDKAGNNGPQEFLGALTGHESGSKEGLKLADPLRVYLEARLRSCVGGKMKKINGARK